MKSEAAYPAGVRRSYSLKVPRRNLRVDQGIADQGETVSSVYHSQSIHNIQLEALTTILVPPTPTISTTDLAISTTAQNTAFTARDPATPPNPVEENYMTKAIYNSSKLIPQINNPLKNLNNEPPATNNISSPTKNQSRPTTWANPSFTRTAKAQLHSNQQPTTVSTIYKFDTFPASKNQSSQLSPSGSTISRQPWTTGTFHYRIQYRRIPILSNHDLQQDGCIPNNPLPRTLL